MNSSTSRSAAPKFAQIERAIASVETAYKRETAGLEPWSKLDVRRTKDSEPDSTTHLHDGLRLVAASLDLACRLIEYHRAAAKITSGLQAQLDTQLAGMRAVLASVGLDDNVLRENAESDRKAHQEAEKSFEKKAEALSGLFYILSKRYWALIVPLKALEGSSTSGSADRTLLSVSLRSGDCCHTQVRMRLFPERGLRFFYLFNFFERLCNDVI